MHLCKSTPGVAAWLVRVIFRLGHWPALTQLTLENYEADFWLQPWPPREEQPLCLPSLAEADFFVHSDAMGLFQLEHTIFSLIYNTSALWDKVEDTIMDSTTTVRDFAAI